MSKNPYIFGPIIQQPEQFFGRHRELAQLQDSARKGMSVAVVGLRRIGKSSLLYQFTHQTVSRADNLVIAYLDLHDSRCHNVPDLLTAALKALDKQLNRRYRFGAITTLEAFTEAVEQMREDGYRPVLCLDEMEALLEPSREGFDDNFFKALRYLGSHSKVAFVTASRTPLPEMIEWTSNSSSFSNIFTQLNLIGLSDTDARTLLTAPFRRAGLRIPPPLHVQEAINLAGHHPYFLQLAGSILWEAMGMKGQRLRHDFANRARPPLRQLWQQLTPSEQAAAIKLAGGKAEVPHWEEFEAELWRLGIAEKNDRGKYQFFSALLAEWIRSGEWEEMMNQPAEADSSQRLIQGHGDWLALLWQRFLLVLGIKN
jgi:hypothetical protein